MRLICPRCGAEYEVEDRLIPASGREVQCSSCDHVWFQLGRLRMLPPVVPPAVAAAAAEDAVPSRMGRALPEDVMDILRGEAAHFRASHPGLDATPAAEAPADPDAVEGEGLPAADEPLAPPAEAAPEPMIVANRDRTDLPAAPEPAMPGDRADEADAERRTAPEPLAEAPPPQGQRPSFPAPADTTAAPEPVPVLTPAGEWQRTETIKRRGGFGRGFLIGLIIAAGFYALYRAAPAAGEGVWGDVLRNIRVGGDALHHWVQARTAGFR